MPHFATFVFEPRWSRAPQEQPFLPPSPQFSVDTPVFAQVAKIRPLISASVLRGISCRSCQLASRDKRTHSRSRKQSLHLFGRSIDGRRGNLRRPASSSTTKDAALPVAV